MSNYFKEVGLWFDDKKHEPINKCIVCDYQAKQELDFIGRSSLGKFTGSDIEKCPQCGFVWRWYQPTQETLNAFYAESKPMNSWAQIKSGEDESVRQLEKYHYVWEFIKQNDVKSILDVGCGNGYFLNNVDSSKLRIGIEMNTASKSHCGFPVYENMDSFANSVHSAHKFDIITMFGVLEHLKHPVEQLQFYAKYLKDSGTFCVIVPNIDSLAAQTLGMECSTYCPQHLWYYNPATLSRIAEKASLYLERYITVESEIQPILRKLKGLNPYLNLGFDLTDRDITAEKILNNGLGYKIIAFFIKGEIDG